MRTQIFEDVVFVHPSGVLTPAENRLARKQDGVGLNKDMLLCSIESSRGALERLVVGVMGCNVVSLHTDLSTRTGERFVVFMLDQNLERILSQHTGRQGACQRAP